MMPLFFAIFAIFAISRHAIFAFHADAAFADTPRH